MPLTALILLPSSQPSPLPTILSHITLTFPCHSLPPFTLTHHLFASTSSLLPSSSPWPPAEYNRQFFSVLTLSPPSPSPSNTSPSSPSAPPLNVPITYLTTTTPSAIPASIPPPGPIPTPKYPDFKKYKGMEGRSLAEKEATEEYELAKSNYATQLSTSTAAALAALKYDSSSITIPTASTAGWLEMMTTKLTPLWILRGTERVDSGTAISLQGGAWVLRMGELRQSVSKAGVSASTQRGILCEVTWMEAAGGGVGRAVDKQEEGVMRGFVETLLDGTDVKVESGKWLFGYTGAVTVTGEGNQKEGSNWALAELYTELLRTRS